MVKASNQKLDINNSVLTLKAQKPTLSRVEGSKVLLGIRTETAEACLVLASDDGKLSDQIVWTAGRQLSATLLSKIHELLDRNDLTWQNLSGIVVYEGPGSFTGLRIGITVANTAAFVLNKPIVGATGEDWLEWGTGKLQSNIFTGIVMPFYGAEANITKPRG